MSDSERMYKIRELFGCVIIPPPTLEDIDRAWRTAGLLMAASSNSHAEQILAEHDREQDAAWASARRA